MANSIAALFPFVTYGSQIRSDRTWIYYSIMPHTRCFFLFLAYFVYTFDFTFSNWLNIRFTSGQRAHGWFAAICILNMMME